ncbi:hypothetical protein NDA01_28325 [Trichocoleus desertorum AS-A10]|uniref:hypothetical protein n=1 Tax=Trichocoleus desertorum TaxID=1481672 RepID=UPI003296FFD1
MKLTSALLISLCVSGGSLLYLGNVSAKDSHSLTSRNSASIAPAMTIALQPIAQAKPSATVLALDSQGLRVVNKSTGATRAIAFGTKEADVVSILTNLRGKPRNQGVNQECGAGPLGFARWADGLSLQFNKGRFAGWSVDGRSPGANKLTTINGVGTGSTRTQLNKAYTVKVSQSSLGTEFSAGSLGGLLSGSKPTDRVTSLWSGTTCFFR